MDHPCPRPSNQCDASRPYHHPTTPPNMSPGRKKNSAWKDRSLDSLTSPPSLVSVSVALLVPTICAVVYICSSFTFPRGSTTSQQLSERLPYMYDLATSKNITDVEPVNSTATGLRARLFAVAFSIPSRTHHAHTRTAKSYPQPPEELPSNYCCISRRVLEFLSTRVTAAGQAASAKQRLCSTPTQPAARLS